MGKENYNTNVNNRKLLNENHKPNVSENLKKKKCKFFYLKKENWQSAWDKKEFKWSKRWRKIKAVDYRIKMQKNLNVSH